MALNQNNVYERSVMSTRSLLFQWGDTKNPTNRVGLEQCGHIIILSLYSCKIVYLGLINNHSFSSCTIHFVFQVQKETGVSPAGGVCILYVMIEVRRVWRYQSGNQNPYIEEEQTTQWPKEKVQKDKQRSTKHTHTTKDRVTRTPQKMYFINKRSYICRKHCMPNVS